MTDASKLSPPQVVIVVSAIVALVGSFLPWYDFEGFGGSLTANAWDDALFPTYTWPAVLGVTMGVQVLIATFSTVSLRDTVAGFTWLQLHLVLAAFSALIAVSFLIAGEEHGVGFWLSLIASIGLVVGAVMLNREGVGTQPPGAA